jgi:hypothetical protein
MVNGGDRRTPLLLFYAFPTDPQLWDSRSIFWAGVVRPLPWCLETVNALHRSRSDGLRSQGSSFNRGLLPRPRWRILRGVTGSLGAGNCPGPIEIRWAYFAVPPLHTERGRNPRPDSDRCPKTKGRYPSGLWSLSGVQKNQQGRVR